MLNRQEQDSTLRTTLGLAVAMALLQSACGAATSAEVRTATKTEYRCDFQVVWQAALDEFNARFEQVAASDVERLIYSQFRWHDRSGHPKLMNTATVRDGDVIFRMVVAIQRGADGWRVLPQAEVMGYELGNPKPVEFQNDDPRKPAWVDGKVDSYRVAVYRRLPQCREPTAAAGSSPQP